MRINVHCWKCGTSNEVESEPFLLGRIVFCQNTTCEVPMEISRKDIQDDLKESPITCPHCRMIHILNLLEVQTFDCPNCNNNIF